MSDSETTAPGAHEPSLGTSPEGVGSAEDTVPEASASPAARADEQDTGRAPARARQDPPASRQAADPLGVPERAGGGLRGGRRLPGRASWRPAVRRAGELVVATALVCAVAAVVWWGQTRPLAASPVVLPVTATQAGAQTVYVCPAAPANTLQAVDVAPMTASTVITPVGEADTVAYAGRDVHKDKDGGDGDSVGLDGAEGGVLTVDSQQEGEVASASGAVTTLAASGDLRGLTTATCTQPSAVSWIVGGSAAPGSSAELRLANPGATTVTATVSVYGSSGRLSLPSNGQVTVPEGSARSILLETASGADSRLAVSVEAEGGTLVPVLVTEALDGETAAGTDVLNPGAAPSTELVVPGVQVVSPEEQGEQAQESTGAESSDAPVVRVVNPGDEPAAATVTMLGQEGPVPLPGAADVTVDPGAVFDISLAGVSPGTYGVQVSADRPVAAAVRLVRSGGELPQRSGSLVHDQAWVQAGAEGALASGVLAVPRGENLDSALSLANSGQAATVSVSSADGAWHTDVPVPAGGAVTVDVPGSVSAVTLSTDGSGGGLAAATVVTADVAGDAAGTLISVVPAVADAAAAAQRDILLD